jgi:salicylate hydroxylase
VQPSLTGGYNDNTHVLASLINVRHQIRPSTVQRLANLVLLATNMPPLHFELDIIIVGAGLGGLSAAISCALAGHRVRVLESAKQLAEIGAGLQITPNGAKLLRRWGLGEQIDKMSAIPTTITVHRYAKGEVLAFEDGFDQNLRRKYGEPFLDIHRADLQRLLCTRAEELGVQVLLGHRVRSIQQEPSPAIILESGDTLSCDLVVGADGLWSRCRESLVGHSDEPLPTGDLAYRIVLTADNLDDPELRQWITHPQVHFWVGPHSHVVAYSLRAGKEYNIVLLCPDNLPKGVARQAGGVDEMRALFKKWDPILTRFLDCVKSVDKWKLMHRPPLDSWTNKKGNFVLMGDACHPMLPYLAQGANSSLEDGAVLGGVLAYVKGKKQVKEAVRMYERLRKARGEAIVKQTFEQRNAFHMPDGPEQEKRDALFTSQLGKEIDVKFPSRW